MIRQEVYGYNAVDDLTTKNLNNGSNFVYGYDQIHQLTSESVPELPNNYAFSYTLDYDSNGNRLHKYWSNGNTDTYSYDHDDRLLGMFSSAGSASSYSYDNYKRPTQIGSSTNYKSLTWDVEDRLLSVSQTQGGINTTLGTYGYNGLGARVSKQTGSQFRSLARDGCDVGASVVNDGTSNYVPGIGMATGSSVRTFASDHLGTQCKEIDGSGNVTATREYDTFGNILNGPRQGSAPSGYAGD